MGVCLSRKESERERRHVGVSGMHNHNQNHNHNHNHHHKNHEPFVNQSKTPFQQPYQLPNKQAPGTNPTVKRSDTNTILGKQFEDVRQIYTLGKELGRGRFGVTYLCTMNSTGLTYACKSISKSNLVSEPDKEDIRREIQIMQHMSGQPNIVEFKGAYEDKNSVHVVMELCAGGALYDTIIAKGKYSERDAASIFRQIVDIVHICHFMGVMHRDLKPENFLLASEDDKATIKATDFGLSVFIEEGKIFIHSLVFRY